jgi:SAM-dependent methyltransferase
MLASGSAAQPRRLKGTGVARGRSIGSVDTPYVRESGYAQRYRDRRFATAYGPRTDRRERRALRSLLRECSAAAGPWLDAPCGTGRLAAELPGPVVQLDRDHAMLRACRDPRRRVCAAVSALPFADGAFAGVLCCRFLQHLPDPAERRAVLRELARVSRGPVIVSFFDALSLQHARRLVRRRLGKKRSGRTAITRGALLADLRAAGLRPLRWRALGRFVAEQTLVACRIDAAT